MSPWVVPGYTEERELGQGASGRVVAAIRDATGHRVAVKYLSPRLFGDPEFLAGFRAEARLLQSLDVPQVVQLFDYVEQPARGAAIVMELVNGVSLHELISRQGATSAESALVVLKGSLLGLAAAHQLGIVHRDYKPENVLVDGEGNSKLTDFGVAVREGSSVPAAGTPLYMAPEQWDGAPASPASDIYAAAAVFFECLTSKTPFTGQYGQLMHQHMTASVPVDEVDWPLRSLIVRGMAKDPRQRPASATAFLAEMEATATATYGPEWEERGRSQLKERAAALLLLLLDRGGSGAGSGSASILTRLGGGRRLVYIGAAAAVAIAVGVGATAYAISDRGQHRPQAEPTVTAVAAASTAPASSAPGSTPPPGGTPTVKPTASVLPPAVTSACATPVTFAYSGAITVSAPGTVSYQWVYSSGAPGPVQTLAFPTAGTKTVTGADVQSKVTGTGWGQIRVISPATVTSNQATYHLNCSTAPVTVSAAASVTPPTVSTGCYTPPPSFTFSGTITSKKAGPVSYYWQLPTGNGPAQTLNFTGPGTMPVTSPKVTAASDNATGSGTIVITSPTATSSNTAKFTVSCGQPKITLGITSTPASPTTVACGTTPPAFKLTGSITSDQSVSSVTYHWTRPDGTTTSPATVALAGGTTKTVTDQFTAPASLSLTGNETLAITAPFTASKALALKLACTYQDIAVTATLPGGTVGVAYSATATGSGGKAPYKWSAAGLPAGLSIDAETGTISGTPTAGGSSTVTITATDSQSPAKTGSVQSTLVIAYPALQVTTGSLPNGTVGSAYSATLAATGGDGDYSWSAAGLPNGLSISAGGTISGTPSGATSTVNVTVKDGESSPKTASKQFTLTLSYPPLQISTGSLPAAAYGATYPSTQLQATGGDKSYTWSQAGLPDGLSLSSDGVLSGGSKQYGSFTVTATVRDGHSTTAQKTFTLTIYGPLSITTSSLGAWTQGTANKVQLVASGGGGSYSWSWSAKSLPAGLSLTASGVINGTPTGSGTYPITFTVKDSVSGASASKSISLVISPDIVVR